ncbi:MAG: chemotaxis protein CheW [Chlorobiales bacterium]|jgi:chemotaxis signal transduction protein|nr:chemotaxis protein CheW [Chlorobiales bacterium]
MLFNDQPSSGEKVNILVCEIGEMLFGIETHAIRMTTEFSALDQNVLIKPYVGTMQLADDKIPLLNLNTFFKLPSITDNESLGGIIVTFNNRNFFSLIVSRIIGTVSVEGFYKFPAEAALYPDVYKSLFPFKDTYLLLLDLKKVFYHIIEFERKTGTL